MRNAESTGLLTERELFREFSGLAKTDGGERRGLNRDHGEYFTTTQVARELGITRSGVDRLRKAGTLLAFRRRRRSCAGCGSPWWFFLKEDVFNLKHDSEYRRLHERNLATRRRVSGEYWAEGELAGGDGLVHRR